MDLMEAARDVVAASVAGAAGIVAGQPFDTVKVRLQTQPSALPGQALRYSGPLHCAWRILKEEGVRGFFKGMVSPIVANAPINALLFAVEGATMKRLARDGWDPEAASSHAVAGAVSGLSQTPLASSSELVKIRLQCQLDSGGSHGPLETARGILRAEGLAGLFRGYTATLARDVPAFGIYFGSYHVMKQALAEAHPIFQAADDEDDEDDAEHDGQSGTLPAAPAPAAAAASGTESRTDSGAAAGLGAAASAGATAAAGQPRGAGSTSSGASAQRRHSRRRSRPAFLGERGGWQGPYEGPLASGEREVRLPIGPSVWGEHGRVRVSVRGDAGGSSPAKKGAAVPDDAPMLVGAAAAAGPLRAAAAAAGAPTAAAAAASGASARAEPGALAQLLAGGVAGTASWLLLHPIDVIKSVVQQQTPATPAEQLGPLRAARHHLRVDGPRFFLRGIVPTCLRAFPASAVIFLVYETIRPVLPF
ncbi:hypothetical protein FNF31_07901 [Cafeteria roenbergensis]|uniref:Mitochondrial carrier protein n=2 Tax=Cafeteria roenbergensis TaxID=33653 RepID=A0A5A8C217_CAFRO|nr:hypothetical protein FNF31_07901 [Cafeteria roenbergensis]KAA0158775.1 hypothetical protein FNF28_06108 [Cafeteria roenbergensis]